MKKNWIIIILVLGFIYLLYKVIEISNYLKSQNKNIVLSQNIRGFHTDLTQVFSNKDDELVIVKTARGYGSGFVYKQDKNIAYVVTSFHNVENTQNITVGLANYEEVKAELFGAFKEKDIALLKIETNYQLKPVILGDNQLLKPLEYVVGAFVFSADDLKPTYSLGVVSNSFRQFKYDQQVMAFIQSDVKTVTGASGGPLYNMGGQVVGINTVRDQIDNYNYALSINELKLIVNQMLNNKKVSYHDLGLFIKPIKELKTYEKTNLEIDLNLNSGVYIYDLVNSLGNKIGLKKKDIIVKINNQDINDEKDYLKMLYSDHIKDVTIVRNNQVITLGNKLND